MLMDSIKFNNVKTKETREMLRYKDKLIKTYVVPKCTNLKSARRLTVFLPKLANYVLNDHQRFNIQLVEDLIINIKSNFEHFFFM